MVSGVTHKFKASGLVLYSRYKFHQWLSMLAPSGISINRNLWLRAVAMHGKTSPPVGINIHNFIYIM